MFDNIKVGTRVKHERYGKGTVVFKDDGSFLVEFDKENTHLHDGHPFRNGIEHKKFKENRCWWFYMNHCESELKCIGGLTTSIDLPFKYSWTISNTIEPNKHKALPSKYIINEGASILFWEDGSKTVVKRCKEDEYNKRLGFLTAYFQKTSGLSKNKANKYLHDLVDETDLDKLDASDFIRQLLDIINVDK